MSYDRSGSAPEKGHKLVAVETSIRPSPLSTPSWKSIKQGGVDSVVGNSAGLEAHERGVGAGGRRGSDRRRLGELLRPMTSARQSCGRSSWQQPRWTVGVVASASACRFACPVIRCHVTDGARFGPAVVRGAALGDRAGVHDLVAEATSRLYGISCPSNDAAAAEAKASPGRSGNLSRGSSVSCRAFIQDSAPETPRAPGARTSSGRGPVRGRVAVNWTARRVRICRRGDDGRRAAASR